MRWCFTDSYSCNGWDTRNPFPDIFPVINLGVFPFNMFNLATLESSMKMFPWGSHRSHRSQLLLFVLSRLTICLVQGGLVTAPLLAGAGSAGGMGCYGIYQRNDGRLIGKWVGNPNPSYSEFTRKFYCKKETWI